MSRSGAVHCRAMTRGVALVSFGEAMVRLCPPGFGRLEMASHLEMQPGGAELNTAVGVARLCATSGHRAAWVSRLPGNALGHFIANKAREQGVATQHIAWDTAPDARCGVYYLEEGAAPRASSVLYDRVNSSFARLPAGTFDWPDILAGARFFLVTGITAALGQTCLDETRAAMQAARASGAQVIFDPNFRSRLWTLAQARQVYLDLAPLVDILACSHDGLKTFYDVDAPEPVDAATQACRQYGLRAVVMTTRVELGMWRNRVGATVVVAGGERDGVQVHHDVERDVEIVDRLGAGDAFLSGFIYGLLTGTALTGTPEGLDWARATAYGGACGALKHSIRGDFPILTAEELRQEIESPALRVRR